MSVNQYRTSTKHVKKAASNSGLSKLALAFALPHEHPPQRLPAIPASLTCLLDVMSDTTKPVQDQTAKSAALCRDPCYPLWMTQLVSSAAWYIEATGTALSWNIPARSNSVLALPIWDRVGGAVGGSPTIDGASLSVATLIDYGVLANAPGTQAVYVPPGGLFSVRIFTGAAGGGSGIELEIVYQVGGEEFTATLIAASVANGFEFAGAAGGNSASTGSVTEGIVPYGFVYLRQWRTTTTAPTASNTPVLQMGWFTGGSLSSPSGQVNLFLPVFVPPEFGNSTLPYSRTRLNSSAALFTNVTAALSKEGTILASRLKQSVVDMWSFSPANINSVHPSLRYFGPMEKGLYTFTTPSVNAENFSDRWISMPSPSSTNSSARPLFDYKDYGVYNAMVFSDLGSASAGTQLAVSLYAHLEFEAISSLFSPGVSTSSLETLHAAEIALLRFGHFHENPLHWAVLKAAAMTAVRALAPMVTPVLKQVGIAALNKGVEYLRNRPAGDRAMKQGIKTAPPEPKRARKPARPKPRSKRK